LSQRRLKVAKWFWPGLVSTKSSAKLHAECPDATTLAINGSYKRNEALSKETEASVTTILDCVSIFKFVEVKRSLSADPIAQAVCFSTVFFT
jgi:hypothetical protein